MEVCVESIESAVNAERGGAKRIELCSALSEGGLTPSLGLLKVIKSKVNIPVFVMLRPTPGHFVYNDSDIECIKHDAKLFLEAGADGFVFGALTREGCIDKTACQEIMKIVSSKPVTFHRAFDWTRNPRQALEDIIELGFQRILTSGQAMSVDKGIQTIKELMNQAGSRILIMPGAGINEENIFDIIKSTRVEEFHASARINRKIEDQFRNTECSMGTQDEFTKITDVALVNRIVHQSVKALQEN